MREVFRNGKRYKITKELENSLDKIDENLAKGSSKMRKNRKFRRTHEYMDVYSTTVSFSTMMDDSHDIRTHDNFSRTTQGCYGRIQRKVLCFWITIKKYYISVIVN